MTNYEMNHLLKQLEDLFHRVLATNHVTFNDDYYDDLLQEMRIAVFQWMQDYQEAASFLAAFPPGRLFTRLRWLVIDCLRKRHGQRKRNCPLTESEESFTAPLLQDPLNLIETTETWQQFWLSLKPYEQHKLRTLLAEAESGVPCLNRKQRYKYRQHLRQKMKLFLEKQETSHSLSSL